MKTTLSTVNKLKIEDIERLDPVTVIYEDFEPGHGKIIIECYGKVWTTYWGGMGDYKIQKFFCRCNNDYIIGRLAPLERKKHEYNYLSRIIDAVKKGFETLVD